MSVVSMCVVMRNGKRRSPDMDWRNDQPKLVSEMMVLLDTCRGGELWKADFTERNGL